jgi:hypothetical protein
MLRVGGVKKQITPVDSDIYDYETLRRKPNCTQRATASACSSAYKIMRPKKTEVIIMADGPELLKVLVLAHAQD